MSGRSRLRWHCRRGMKELDELLVSYLDNRYPSASPGQRRRFEALVEQEDPVLAGWLLGGAVPRDPELAEIVREIRAGIES